MFAAAARRGVDVRGLVWRSHWDRLAFSAAVAGLLRRSPDGAVCRSGYGRFQRRASTCQWAPFDESTRDVDLALTLALTETLALRDLIRPSGSQPQLTPVLLASPSMQGARS